ncbi:hypothetical protein KKH82_04390 [Patescibacteria group bacterium]|nr:hypothetical protein [Patescibacteria group bacterium]
MNVYHVGPLTHVLLNVIEAITSVLVHQVISYDMAHVTGVLSIRLTVAVQLHGFPYISWNVKTKDQFPVNTLFVAFNHVMVSENHVMVAVTSWLVSPVVEYSMLAVGEVVSITLIVLVFVHVFHEASTFW